MSRPGAVIGVAIRPMMTSSGIAREIREPLVANRSSRVGRASARRRRPGRQELGSTGITAIFSPDNGPVRSPNFGSRPILRGAARWLAGDRSDACPVCVGRDSSKDKLE